jgi:hypothetical protein
MHANTGHRPAQKGSNISPFGPKDNLLRCANRAAIALEKDNRNFIVQARI